jgi:hypothetical protein
MLCGTLFTLAGPSTFSSIHAEVAYCLVFQLYASLYKGIRLSHNCRSGSTGAFTTIRAHPSTITVTVRQASSVFIAVKALSRLVGVAAASSDKKYFPLSGFLLSLTETNRTFFTWAIVPS